MRQMHPASSLTMEIADGDTDADAALHGEFTSPTRKSAAYVPSRWLCGLTLDPRDRHEVSEETSGIAHGHKMRTLRAAITAAGQRQQ